MLFSKTQKVETNQANLAWMLALSAILTPMLSWSTSMLDETRFDGGLFSILCLFPIVYSLAHKRFALFPGSIYIFTAISLGSFAFFIDPRFQFSYESAYQGLADRAPILSTLILMCCLYAWPRPKLNKLVTIICWFTSVACTFALVQALGWDPPGYANILGRRPAYPFTGLNHAGEIVTPILLLSIALLVDSKSKMVLITPMLLVTGFWGGNAIRLGIILGLIILNLSKKLPLKKGALYIVLFIAGEILRSQLSGKIASLEEEAVSSKVRIEIYQSAIEKSFTTPLGIGIGQFEHSYPSWRSESEKELTSSNKLTGNYRAPKSLHNEFLQALLELGWAGFLLLAIGIVRFFKAIHESPYYSNAYFAATTAFLVCTMVRSPLTDNAISLPLFALLSIAILPPKNKRSFFDLGLAPLALITIPPGYDAVRAEYHLAQGIQEDENIFERINLALESRSYDARTWIILGEVYLRQDQNIEARTCYQNALSYHPYDLSALMLAIRVESHPEKGNPSLMSLHLETAEKLMPNHEQVLNIRRSILQERITRIQANATQLTQQSNALATRYWLALNLVEAQLALHNKDNEGAIKSLYRAASLAESQRGLIERTARKKDLNRQLLNQLILKVYPNWPIID